MQSTQAIVSYFAYSNLAAAYALEGKDGRGEDRALAEARGLNPELTMKWLIAHTPNLPIVRSYRKSGLPDK